METMIHTTPNSLPVGRYDTPDTWEYEERIRTAEKGLRRAIKSGQYWQADRWARIKMMYQQKIDQAWDDLAMRLENDCGVM